MGTVWYILYPALLQLIVSELVSALAGSVLDGATCSALSALIVLPFALWMFRRDKALHQGDLKARDAGRPVLFIGTLLLCLLAGGTVNILLSWIMSLLKITASFSNEAQESLLGSALLMQLAGPCLLVPIVEELIFRGLCYPRMRTIFSAWPAALISSLLFAIYHGNLIQMIYAFPMALILAWIYEKGKSLIYPISFHIGANLIAVLAAAFL